MRSETEEHRAQRLAEIRRQVDDGSYETPERIAGAVDRLWLALGGEGAEGSLGRSRPPASNGRPPKAPKPGRK